MLQYLADLPASDGTSVESGCGYSTVVLANVFGTHICVNPDLASNRLVREFVERHCGATGLRHVETSSDQGLPDLVAEGLRVELALIDGNHSHPFPMLDFHYMDQMLDARRPPARRQHRDPRSPGADRLPRVGTRLPSRAPDRQLRRLPQGQATGSSGGSRRHAPRPPDDVAGRPPRADPAADGGRAGSPRSAQRQPHRSPAGSGSSPATIDATRRAGPTRAPAVGRERTAALRPTRRGRPSSCAGTLTPSGALAGVALLLLAVGFARPACGG